MNQANNYTPMPPELLAQKQKQIERSGLAEVDSSQYAQELALHCQKQFPEIAYLEVRRAGYEFLVYNAAGREKLGQSFVQWLHNDLVHVEQDYRMLHTLGFDVPKIPV